ncbi:hypothetical protein Clacol_001277 [Clathrus columnatus]|uniref:Uncharacterized protein n=1 Tax=Clathrus columnatus TaxID=1419009 RepID=A0AAV5A373_9AGAM|nr:hypothetical protein Clacol_001277 [Clathrus columnatus]
MSRSWTSRREREYVPSERVAYPEAYSSSGAGMRHVNGSDTRYYEEPVQIRTGGHRSQKGPIIIEGEILNPVPATRSFRNLGGRTSRRPRRSTRDNRDRRRYYSKNYQQNPSVMRGIWNKVIGTLTGNRRRKRHGEREIRHARRIKEALRIARQLDRQDAARDAEYGRPGMNKLRKSQRQTYGTNGHHHHHHQDPVFVSADPAYGSSQPPWMHDHRRTPSPLQGLHHVIIGWLTGNKRRRRIGKAMMMAAEEDRRREREIRREEMREVARRGDKDRIWTF